VHCSKCGNNNSDNAKFCSGCGSDLKPVRVSDMNTNCSRCESEIINDSIYCIKCGHKLDDICPPEQKITLKKKNPMPYAYFTNSKKILYWIGVFTLLPFFGVLLFILYMIFVVVPYWT
jgi:uncharacterized membrane protein YvbJ